jgi:hypothetical protein
MRWSTYDPADPSKPIMYADEPREAGVRNWGLAARVS